MDFKRLRPACASIMKRIKCVRLFVGLVVVTLPVAAFPWSLFNSDASKYRDECRAKCIEDSFGKAGAREIEQRCSTKCNGLPTSPRREWSDYDHCVSYFNGLIEGATKCLGANGKSTFARECSADFMFAEMQGWTPGESISSMTSRKCSLPTVSRPK